MTSCLTKRDPFSDVFSELFSAFGYDASYAHKPEITENEKEFAISADMPGMSVTVGVASGILTISGKRMKAGREAERKYSYRLPTYVDVAGIAAVYEQGVLRVVLPKTNGPPARAIPVEVK